MRLHQLILGIFLIAFGTGTLLADDETDRALTRVQFEANASQQVENDTMRATLFVEVEDNTPSGASSRATRAANETLRQLQKDSSLSVRTGNYRTYPVSDKGKISGWRARSEIIIESGNFSQASAAIASVSANMQLSRIEFFVSPALRDIAESGLTDEAIAAFLLKAKRIAESFGATQFHVAEANVTNTGGNFPPSPMMRAMSDDAPAVIPELSGGTTLMSVTVSGAILIAR